VANGTYAPWFARRPTARRSQQIARVLTGHGLGALVDRSGLARFAPRLRRTPRPSPLSQAARIRMAFGELGVTFTKLGQMLSTRPDLLPPDFIEELSKLQDCAPPVPLEHIRSAIREDLGDAPEAIFESFDPLPIAAASIGQVHAATLRGGARVVVKVRRPGVMEQVESDLEILAGIARWVELNTAFGRDYELMPIVEEFAYTIRNEMDYRREGENADRLRRFLADESRVRIPLVHWDLSSERVLTLERIEGTKLNDFAALDRLGIPRRSVAETAVRVFLRCALELGMFHADPHPGNFFAQPDGTIGIVDFGMIGRLNAEVRQHLLSGGLAAIRQDAETLAEELYALGVAGRHTSQRAFLRDLDHVISRYGGMSLHELSAGEVTAQLTSIARRHKLQLPGELAVLMRVATMSEGIGLRLDPEFHYLEYATPFFRREWQRSHSLVSAARRVGRSAAEAAELSVELPRRVRRLLGRFERGELELNVRHEGLSTFADQLQRMTNRLALAVVLASSVVALGVALGVHRLRGLERYLDWLFTLGFMFSLGFGLWLVFSIWLAGRRG
jgi:ubiquinone biosynthesis protein